MWLSWLALALPESPQAAGSGEPQDNSAPSVLKRALGAAPGHGVVLMGRVVLAWGGGLGLFTTHVWPTPSPRAACTPARCCHGKSDPRGIGEVTPRPRALQQARFARAANLVCCESATTFAFIVDGRDGKCN